MAQDGLQGLGRILQIEFRSTPPYTSQPIILLWITPSAKRNTYSVAIPFCINTQGSGLRPQPWAGEAQLHYLSAPHCTAPVTFGSELPGVRTLND